MQIHITMVIINWKKPGDYIKYGFEHAFIQIDNKHIQ